MIKGLSTLPMPVQLWIILEIELWARCKEFVACWCMPLWSSPKSNVSVAMGCLYILSSVCTLWLMVHFHCVTTLLDPLPGTTSLLGQTETLFPTGDLYGAAHLQATTLVQWLNLQKLGQWGRNTISSRLPMPRHPGGKHILAAQLFSEKWHHDTCELLLDSDGSDAASLCELDGDELEENLAALGQSVDAMNNPNSTGWNEMFQVKTTKEWEKLEKSREKEVWEPVAVQEKMKTSYIDLQDPSEMYNRDYDSVQTHSIFKLCMHVLWLMPPIDLKPALGQQTTGWLPAIPPLKHHWLEVPFHMQCKIHTAKQWNVQERAPEDVDKLLKSKKTVFAGGPNGLQNGHDAIKASKMAAECHGFTAAWGGCQVCSWTRVWISQCTLPVSLGGCHAKVYLLLDDPAIATELCMYVPSNKWAMDAWKLSDFTKDKLVLAEPKKYLQGIVQNEMPQGLKCYMEIELFPHIHLKVGKGISLATAW
ncbi:hypothetical protein EDD16DRAFT_1527624 [Pisolithus croceorrhizus]|nr:hypothetical protein EDD16DRAFT_1527624 [Pisolithus croceorrhizus]